MSKTSDRMTLAAEILALIDRKRVEAGDPNLGSSIERALLDAQIHEVEQDIFENPGAIEPMLVRRRGQ